MKRTCSLTNLPEREAKGVLWRRTKVASIMALGSEPLGGGLSFRHGPREACYLKQRKPQVVFNSP